MKTLIIGVGNVLRGDDGIGFRVAEWFENHSNNESLTVIAAHQLLPEMADDISRADRAIFVDANVTLPAGKVQQQEIQPETTVGAMAHHLTPETLLYWSNTLYSKYPQAFLVTVGVYCVDVGTTLSSIVNNVKPQIIARVERLCLKGTANGCVFIDMSTMPFHLIAVNNPLCR